MKTKDNKPLLIIIFSLVAIFFFYLMRDPSKSENTTTTSNPTVQDPTESGSIKSLLSLIAESSEGEIVSESPIDVSWTTSGPSLSLTDGRIITLEGANFDKIESYLLENDWGTEDMFWAYKTDISSEIGYLTKKTPHPFSGAMCILDKNNSTVRCGFGPR